MVTEVVVDTGLVLTVKVALVALPGTVTLAGTLATPGLLLDRLTTAPPLGAGPLSVTVPVEELPPVTLVGLRLSDESVGALAVTVKLLALVAVPPGVVTLSGPVVAPLGTVAEIEVEEVAVKLALVPLNRTAEAPVKFVPVIVTGVPTGPLVGVKLVIVGAGMTVKLFVLVAVPPGVVTLSGPVVAPLGTVAEIEVEEVPAKLALVPLNRTAEAPVRFVPVIVTGVPTGPLVGVKLVIVGAGMTATVFVLVAVPPGDGALS